VTVSAEWAPKGGFQVQAFESSISPYSSNRTTTSLEMLELDGSTLEGGGQLVRVALCLSAICGVAVRVVNVRAKRPGRKVGLKESHVKAVEWLADRCEAVVEGGKEGSQTIEFVPRKMNTRRRAWSAGSEPWEGESVLEMERPGSVWLVWQAIWPYIVFAIAGPGDDDGQIKRNSDGEKEKQHRGSETTTHTLMLTLTGGTNVSKSMSGEYVQQVLLPVCQKIGLPTFQVEVVKRGWAGSAQEVGQVRIRVDRDAVSRKFRLSAFTVSDRGVVTQIDVTIVAGSQKTRTGLRGAITALLWKAIGQDIPVNVIIDEDSGDEQRLYVLLAAHTSNGWRLGRDFLGGQKVKSEKEGAKMVQRAAEAVVRDLLNELRRGGCVDEFMQDQLVVFQALAMGRSVVDAGKGRGRGTLHTQTVRWVCDRMLSGGGFMFDEGGGCDGVGWNAEKDETERARD